ncbi:DUF2497 domain-containing protein [Marinivivus vitaminiproducens]|uniref:DUF2497 domain-containing protein n=1 Tax=Marinivivus vitaminiproducens TaxID=3035935 RepID=UPI00279F572F|nr:DUF2497 domain-containing protein [Geminicoccaceae bacterium SCSIO 64248]
MSSARDVKEPSMEEILSSIRRIIAYDDDGPADDGRARPVPAEQAAMSASSDPLADEESAEEDDVLELTTEADPAPPRTSAAVRPAAAAAPPLHAPSASGGPALAATGTSADALAPATAAPSSNPSQESLSMSIAPKTDTLVSDTASSATMGAFSRLSQNLTPAAPSAMPAAGDRRTVDELVVDALKPELRAWLDKNLPSIVERLVQQEISKMARRAELV